MWSRELLAGDDPPARGRHASARLARPARRPARSARARSAAVMRRSLPAVIGRRLDRSPVGEAAALERRAVDVVERRHDRAERCQVGGRARPRRPGSPGGRCASSVAGRTVEPPRVGPRRSARSTSATPADRRRTVSARARPRRASVSSRSDLDAWPRRRRTGWRAGPWSPRRPAGRRRRCRSGRRPTGPGSSRWLESRIARPRSWTSVAEQVEDLDDAERVDRRSSARRGSGCPDP